MLSQKLSKIGVAVVILFVVIGVIKIGVRAVRIAAGQIPEIGDQKSQPRAGQPLAEEVRTIIVEPFRYKPDMVVLKADTPYQLRFVTNNVYSCIRSLVIPRLGIREYLPATGEKIVYIPPLKAGQYEFMCSMGMYRGILLVN